MESEPAIVVSSDSHVGPLLVGQLRAYCPRSHLEDFDAFVAASRAAPPALAAKRRDQVYGQGTVAARRLARNLTTEGHTDVRARLRDMDRDGVAAAVVFHGSTNDEVLPFGDAIHMIGQGRAVTSRREMELKAVGCRIYNRWLADMCNVEPDRHVGLAYVPVWDVAAAVAEVEWARSVGLRGVNFPPPRPEYPDFTDPVWEPLWAAAADHGMPLTTHGGGGAPQTFSGQSAQAMFIIESGGYAVRRGMYQLVLSGAFDRHPGLRLVLTEQPGDWWPFARRELESVADTGCMAQSPQHYFDHNLFFGVSFLSHHEATVAVREGFVPNVLWGSDYPHAEGTWTAQEPDAPSSTKLALRDALAGLPGDVARAMAGENAIRCYGLDREALAAVAARIGALRPDELVTPIDPDDPAVAAVVEDGRLGGRCFRLADNIGGRTLTVNDRSQFVN